VLAHWRQKKSVKQEKVAQVIFGSTGLAPSKPTSKKNITRFKARRTPFRLMLFHLVYF
jgi:hypothetical protein